MKNGVAFFAVTLGCVCLSWAEERPASTAVPKGTVTKYTFEGSAIFPGTVRDYWVYVPAQYDGSKPACVHVNQDNVQFNLPAVISSGMDTCICQTRAMRAGPTACGATATGDCMSRPRWAFRCAIRSDA